MIFLLFDNKKMLNRDELQLIFLKLPFKDLINLSASCKKIRQSYQKLDIIFWTKQNLKLKRLVKNPQIDWPKVGYYSELIQEKAFIESVKRDDLWYLKTIQIREYLLGVVAYEALKIALDHGHINIVKYFFWKLPEFQSSAILKLLYIHCLKTDNMKSMLFLRKHTQMSNELQICIRCNSWK